MPSLILLHKHMKQTAILLFCLFFPTFFILSSSLSRSTFWLGTKLLPEHSSSVRAFSLLLQSSSSPSLLTHLHLPDRKSGCAGRKSPFSEQRSPRLWQSVTPEVGKDSKRRVFIHAQEFYYMKQWLCEINSHWSTDDAPVREDPLGHLWQKSLPSWSW